MNSNNDSRMSTPEYAPCIEISLDNLVHNLEQIRNGLARGTRIMAVVKDSAYGCGAVPVAKTLERNGVDFFAAALPGEARMLRDAGLASPILVFGEATQDELRWGHGAGVHFSLNDTASVERWRAAGAPVRAHCNIDTGMGRLGITPHEISHVRELLDTNTFIRITGIFTHFACADSPDAAAVHRQLALFDRCREILAAGGITPQFVHAANSAAAIRFPETHFTHVRPGIALYGCRPDPAREPGIDLRPVACLKTRVVKLKRMCAGTPVSYGWRYTTTADTRIATLSAGYAHGVPRFLSNKGCVLIGGKRYPVAGTVTMDYIMADVGNDTPVAVGDEAVIMGRQGDEIITPDEIARIGGTIGYEILCGLSTGIPRHYTLNEKPS